jgi:hypothetical protein
MKKLMTVFIAILFTLSVTGCVSEATKERWKKEREAPPPPIKSGVPPG